jgi:hypothetical protein
MPFRNGLPLPAFVLHPITALILAAVHLYLATTHLAELVAGHVDWTHIWKGFGALAGAYVFAALASRRAPRPSTMSTERVSRPPSGSGLPTLNSLSFQRALL